MLWEEPGHPIETFSYKLPLLGRVILNIVTRSLRAFNLGLVMRLAWGKGAGQKEEGMIWSALADTMIGMKRLDNIQYCVENVIRNKVAGDLIEAGVWRGGAAIFMRAVLAAYGVMNRRVFVADSFEGLPKPDEARYPQDRGDKHYRSRFLAVSQQQVEANFAKYGLLDEQVVFLKGWFKDSLPVAPIDKLAVLRIDADMYESTLQALSCLYPKLSNGGFCIIDDYNTLGNCRRAVDDYRTREGISSPINCIDVSGVFWQKG